MEARHMVSISRRSFLKNTGILGAAVGLGALAGCDKGSTSANDGGDLSRIASSDLIDAAKKRWQACCIWFK